MSVSESKARSRTVSACFVLDSSPHCPTRTSSQNECWKRERFFDFAPPSIENGVQVRCIWLCFGGKAFSIGRGGVLSRGIVR